MATAIVWIILAAKKLIIRNGDGGEAADKPQESVFQFASSRDDPSRARGGSIAACIPPRR